METKKKYQKEKTLKDRKVSNTHIKGDLGTRIKTVDEILKTEIKVVDQVGPY